MRTVVVGVDDSKNALRAVEWAAQEAMVHGASLRVVHAYQVPVIELTYNPELYDDVRERTREHAQQTLDKVVQHARSRTAGISVDGEIAEGPASRVLVSHSHDGDLLVLGSRGRRGFAGLLLGSVSHQAMHHATCPVVVIPPAR